MKIKFFQIAKNEIQKNLRSILIFSGIIGLMFLYLMNMFDPTLFGQFNEILESYPESIKQMVGGTIDLATIEGFMNTYVFTFAWMWFGIYIMIRTAQDIPEEIENKTIDMVISKPISRLEYLFGKKMQQLLMILMLMLFTFIGIAIGFAMSEGISLSDLNGSHLAITFVWMMCFLITLESTALFFSTFLNPKKAVGLTMVVFIIFFFIGTYYDIMGESVQWLKYFSVFYYYNTTPLMLHGTMDNVVRDILILVGYSAVITTLGAVIFKKRDIPV